MSMLTNLLRKPIKILIWIKLQWKPTKTLSILRKPRMMSPSTKKKKKEKMLKKMLTEDADLSADMATNRKALNASRNVHTARKTEVLTVSSTK